MKRRFVPRLPASLWQALCVAVLLCRPHAISASPPADSVQFCALVDEEQWLRERPAPAGKRAHEKNTGEPGTVRLIYFLPNDRPYRQAVVDSMKRVIVEAQTFFAGQMAAHGYGPMTFRYEKDVDGEPLVHRLDAEHDDAYYLVGGSQSRVDMEVIRVYERLNHVYLIVGDNSRGLVPFGSDRWVRGFAAGSKSRGVAEVSAAFNFILVVHELAHAFGMRWHDFRDNAYVLSYGRNPDRLSVCSAAYLSVTPWFNPEITHDHERLLRPTVEFAGTTQWYSAGAQRVTVPVRVADPDGVHQVMLRVGNPRSLSLGTELNACRTLAGETETVVAFEYDGGIPSGSHWNPSLSEPATHDFTASAIDTRGYTGILNFSMAQRSPYHVATLKGTATEDIWWVAFSPDGAELASGGRGNIVSLWDVASRQEVAAWEGHDCNVVDAGGFSPDGRLLATASWNEIKLWDVASRGELAVMEGHAISSRVWEMAFSPAGDILASASSDRTVRLWDVARQEETAVLEGHDGRVNSVAFSPDGTTVASGAGDNTVRLWDAASRKQIAVLEGHAKRVNSVAFSPDGAILASSGSTDATVRLWDVASRQPFSTYDNRPYRYVRSVAFSPDGAILAISANPARVVLWDVVTEEIIETLTSLGGGAQPIAFSPDGRLLAGPSAFGRIELWDTSPFTSRQSRAPDWDGDGEVGFGDFMKFAAKYGYGRGQAGYDPRYDLDRDGEVGFSDFLILARAFGQSV